MRSPSVPVHHGLLASVRDVMARASARASKVPDEWAGLFGSFPHRYRGDPFRPWFCNRPSASSSRKRRREYPLSFSASAGVRN